MFQLAFLVLAIWVLKAIRDKQFIKNRFVFRDWMAVPFFLFGITTLVRLFLDFNLIIANLPIIELAMLFLLTVPFCFLNIKQSSVVLATIGFILNTLAMTLNGGHMPVDPSVFAKIGVNLTNLGARYVFSSETTKLPFLGDWLYFPYAGGIFSPGDVLVLLGFLILIIQYEKFRRNQINL